MKVTTTLAKGEKIMSSRTRADLLFLEVQSCIVSSLDGHKRKLDIHWVNRKLDELNKVTGIDDHPLSRVNPEETLNSIMQIGVMEGTVDCNAYLCMRPILGKLDLILKGVTDLINVHYIEEQWLEMNEYLARTVICKCGGECCN